MTTIVRLSLDSPAGGPDRWMTMAAQTAEWAQSLDVCLRDAVVLLPFAQLLPPARDAFARVGGWMPRVETTQTLAASAGPAPALQPGQISFDRTIDMLAAAALLRAQPWGAAWARRDARGFEHAARSLVSTAHEMARATFSMLPGERAAHWAHSRELLTPMPGPGATERLLARVALEWACLAPAPATDRLYVLAPPSAWIAVQAGGPDALVTRLMRETGVPCLILDTDVPIDDPFRDAGAGCRAAFTVCDGFEHEAQCAAAQVLAHVRRGEWPVALIAQDRALVRRVRALLEREPLRLLDETGWKLSTTRAAAQVMSLLQATRADAGADALIDWLKSGTVWAQSDGGVMLGALEAVCRRRGIARASNLQNMVLEPPVARVWAEANDVLTELASETRRVLPDWLAALESALVTCGGMAALQADDAGRQVVKALRFARNGAPAAAWLKGVGSISMSLDAFRDWVDAVLEQSTFVPGVEFDEPAHVVITPLARAMLRPFASVVLPGADDKHLGAPPAAATLLSDAQADALGIPTSSQRRDDELLAFGQVLTAPRLTLMRRRHDDSDPLTDSPWVERLTLALATCGRSMDEWQDPRVEVCVTATPIAMGAPSAPGLLPSRLSASSCEALRACPYRFFALNLLRLREDDELEREIEKRDYGTWLHAVLFNFHRDRTGPQASDVEVVRLMALAAQSQAEQGLGDADFLPFAASFASFAPRYVAWLHARDRDGANWLRGEDAVRARPAELEGTELYGVIDRVDEWHEADGRRIQLIDYKTGSPASLTEKVKQPFEDTQLAFYAALTREGTVLPLSAMYLALDGSTGIEEIEHKNVDASAAALVVGLAHDLRRLRAGSGLPALGEGSTCEYCAARGICRRDHWAEPASPGAAP